MAIDVQDEVTLVHLSTVATRNYLIVGALVLLVWEYAVTAKDEFSFIWRKPFNYVKLLYILSRYYGLVAQSVNVYLALNRLSYLPLHQDTCRTWALFLIFSSGVHFTVLDCIVMIRLYALHRKDRRIGFMLFCAFVMELAVGTGCAYAIYYKTSYDITCDSYEMPFHTVYLMSPVMAMQIVIWTMTVYKVHSLGARHNIPTLVEILRVVIRDGTCTFLLILTIYIATIPDVAASRILRMHATLIFPISMLSISGCRSIMNMQRITGVAPEHSHAAH
ncbi:hypothetical protein BDQ17DRAFT_342021 [Cyathus striatus]|nr:hypothetical protein BDQ17DRAFT_342021 [Cyathus striatus]